MAREISIDELPEHVRAQLRGRGITHVGENSPLAPPTHQELRDRKKASDRKKAGLSFELELRAVHRWYAKRGVGYVYPLFPETIGAPAVVNRRTGQVVKPGTLRFKDGGAMPDFAGVVCLRGPWRGVLLDAKGNAGHATYAHDEKQYHQLERLEEYQRAGQLGFLLICDRDLGIAYLVEDLAPLLAREPITLRTTPRRGSQRVSIDEMQHHYPIVRRPPDFTAVSTYAKWDWLHLLEEIHA